MPPRLFLAMLYIMNFSSGNLVLYKNKIARVISVGDKIEIEVGSGGQERVRTKDIILLHPGPLADLKTLDNLRVTGQEFQEDIKAIWEILEGHSVSLSEMLAMISGEDSPALAYLLWKNLQESLYFEGTPQQLVPKTAEAIEAKQQEEQRKRQAEQDWQEFIGRLQSHTTLPKDRPFLTDVEQLAYGKTKKSRVLAALGKPETPEAAHTLLLKIKIWDTHKNPHPTRSGATLSRFNAEIPSRMDQNRLDLTHLGAYAIDDEGSLDPDDAISLEILETGNLCLWVHVSDAAALVFPDSPMDIEARKRGATLYLPEGILPMLSEAAIETLGLGLSEVSAALSFGIECEPVEAEDGIHYIPTEVRVHPTWVKVTRHTYEETSRLLDAEPFKTLDGMAHSLKRQRLNRGAVSLDLPEIKVKVQDGHIDIKPIGHEASRNLVQESMMLAGWAAAQFALRNDIPIPFASQELNYAASGSISESADLATMYARRKLLGRTKWNAKPAVHVGLGLAEYAQATSPMRRYLDLVVHQQIRAFLSDLPMLPITEVLSRIGAADLASAAVKEAERKSLRHWCLVYLLNHPTWKGTATVVERAGPRAILLIPELALETSVVGPFSPGDQLQVEIADIDLAHLDFRVRIIA